MDLLLLTEFLDLQINLVVLTKLLQNRALQTLFGTFFELDDDGDDDDDDDDDDDVM